jgi:hypothetical protein
MRPSRSRVFARAIGLTYLCASTGLGCVTSTYDTGLPGGGDIHKDSATFFLWGLVGDKTLDLSQLCPNGVASWKDYQDATDSVLCCVTLGIYMRKSIEVECMGNGPPRTNTSPSARYLLTPDPARHLTEVRPLLANASPRESRP